jgi:hypothetical protein
MRDMDASESPTNDEQVGSGCNGYFGGDVNIAMSGVQRGSVTARYKGTVERLYIRAAWPWPIPGSTGSSKART